MLLALGQVPVNAATITVGGQCTLADAIIAANTDANAGGCTPGLGPDTLVLPPNSPQVLTAVNNTIYGPTGLPVIRSDISIVGNNNIISRNAPSKFRLFAVARTGRLTLSGLTLRGGFAPRHPNGSGGGGVRSVGVLNSTDVTFDRNQTDSGSGGGLWAQNVVNLIRNRFTRNQSVCAPSAPVCPAANGGGVAYAAGAPPATSLEPLPSLAITDSTFTGNIAGTNGGGLAISGQARINNSVFADNAARDGGGLAVGNIAAAAGVGASLRVMDHSATNYQVSAANASSSVAVSGSLLTDNVATESGGGLIVGGGSTLTLNTTVVSGNIAPQGHEAVVQPGAIVEADNANTIGYGGNASVVGLTLGPSDTIAAQPPPDPTPVAFGDVPQTFDNDTIVAGGAGPIRGPQSGEPDDTFNQPAEDMPGVTNTGSGPTESSDVSQGFDNDTIVAHRELTEPDSTANQNLDNEPTEVPSGEPTH